MCTKYISASTCFHLFFVKAPSKGPNINRITTSPNELQVAWNYLSIDESNGIIIKYQVCYQVGLNISGCTNKNVPGGNSTMTNISGLNAATEYAVAVRAFTKIGHGPLGKTVTAKTNESGK